MDPELHELLTAWIGGELEPARYEHLLARVREDSSFRLSFVEEIRILGMLKAVQSSEPRWLRLEDEIGWNATRLASDRTIEEAVVRHVRANPIRRPGWIRGRSAVMSAAACFALIALGMLALSASRRPRPDPIPQASPPLTAAPHPYDIGLAMVLRLERVQSRGSEPALEVGQFLKPGRIRIQAGRVTLTLLNGVVVVVEGPADLDLISVDQIYCRQGKLRTQVPEGAEGFVVSGPGTAVVDLGTEFAVNHSLEGRARGRVFKGMVEATVLSPSGTPQRSEVLRESKTFEINPGAGQIDKIEGAEQFAEPANLAAPPLILDPAYPRVVLESHPRGYWRCENLEGGAFPNQVAGGLPLDAHGPVRVTDASEGNRSVEFVPGDTSQFLSVAEAWKPNQRPGYAVELWFLTNSISHASLANLVAPADSHFHFFMLELTSRNRLTLHKPASIRFVHRLPAGYNGGDFKFSDQYYVPYQWHHLVGQINGDRMEVFMDGNPSPPLTIASRQATPAGQFLLGRLSTLPKHSPGTSRPFYGRMDEIAIYDHPLSATEVRRHFRLATRPSPHP